MANVLVNGMGIYVYDGTAITKINCIKTLDFGSDSTTRIENTCLDEPNTKSYVSGLSDPGQGSIGYDFDDKNTSHDKLEEWARDKKQNLQFYIGSRGSNDAPTLTGGSVTLPKTRTWWSFMGGLSSPTPTFEADALVAYTITLERSTEVIRTPKT